MADFNGRALDCDDCEGERGKRGKRGHRGHRGHDGQDGAAGPTGATGPTVLSGNNFVFRPGEPNPGGNVFADWATLVAALPTVQGFKTIQFDNSIVSPCVIPAGVWDMTQTEWTAYFTGAVNVSIPVTVSDGASFTNLRKIGGEMTVTNLNTVTAPVTLVAGTIFELGLGTTGDFARINNVGPAAFFDTSSLLAGQTALFRMMGAIAGTAPAISHGASPGAVSFTLDPSAQVAANMIVGTNPAANIVLAAFGSSGIVQFSRQQNFAGSIAYQLAGAAFGCTQFTRYNIVPAPLTQLAPVPSPGPIAVTPATPLMNAVLLLNTTGGDIAQVLPVIRAAAPATGAVGLTTPGAGESTGWPVLVKNVTTVGGNNVNLAAAAGETIDGVAGPAALVIPPGEGRILISDGISNWIVF